MSDFIFDQSYPFRVRPYSSNRKESDPLVVASDDDYQIAFEKSDPALRVIVERYETVTKDGETRQEWREIGSFVAEDRVLEGRVPSQQDLADPKTRSGYLELKKNDKIRLGIYGIQDPVSVVKLSLSAA